MTDRTGTLLRLVARAYWEFNLEASGLDAWVVTWPDEHHGEQFDASTDWFDTPDDALLAALELSWSKQ